MHDRGIPVIILSGGMRELVQHFLADALQSASTNPSVSPRLQLATSYAVWATASTYLHVDLAAQMSVMGVG